MTRLQVLGTGVAIAAFAVLGGCNKPAADNGLSADASKALTDIQGAETQWVTDLKNGAVEPIVAHYASGGVLMLPGQTPSVGTDQIRFTWRQMLADKAFALTFKADRVWVAASGDMAYSRGHFSLTSSDPKTHAASTGDGSYVTIWRKAANGTWKALEDIVTPGAVTPAATAATGAGTPPKAAPDVAKNAEAIRAGETQWVADWKARDAAKIGAHYTADADVMNPGSPAAIGTAAINAGVAEGLKDPAFGVTFKADAVTVAPSGDLAYARGLYTLTMTDAKTHKPAAFKGSYLTVYTKQPDGSWKALEDIATVGYAVAVPPK